MDGLGLLRFVSVDRVVHCAFDIVVVNEEGVLPLPEGRIVVVVIFGNLLAVGSDANTDGCGLELQNIAHQHLDHPDGYRPKHVHDELLL